MNRETAKLLENLPISKWQVLEVSGKNWETFGFQEYENINYPEYDICSAPLPKKFDLIIKRIMGICTDPNKKIDVAGVLPDGKAFAKPSELRALLGTNPEMFADCLARKMLTYALGRSLGAKDRCVVDQLVSEMKCSGWGLTVLVKAVARSESFTHREKAPTASNGVRP
jgi:hypothetical protein